MAASHVPAFKWASFRSALALFIAFACAAQAQAGPVYGVPVLGGQLLVESDGHVHISYLGSDAAYYNILFLDATDEPVNEELFNKFSPVDDTLLDLGYFQADTELVFRLDVTNTGRSYYSGSAARNPDGLAHVLATSYIIDGVAVTTVGFEDLFGGGDLDYNDFEFVLTNVVDPPPGAVPETSAFSLLLAGFAAFGLLGWGRRRLAG